MLNGRQHEGNNYQFYIVLGYSEQRHFFLVTGHVYLQTVKKLVKQACH